MASSRRCIFLAGAPEADLLEWDEEILSSAFDVRHKRFLDESTITSSRPTPSSTASFAKWRSIDVERPKSLKLARDNDVQPTQFLSFDDGAEGTEDENHVGFFEHSMMLHEDMDVTQIMPSTKLPDDNKDAELQSTFLPTDTFTTTSLTGTSFQTSNGSFSELSMEGLEQPSITQLSCPVTDLRRIPNADYIFRLLPQTMTVNLLLGIITVLPIRTVPIRRRGGHMDIIELIVGDETKAGFRVSFWLVPVESQRRPPDDLRDTLKRLRAGNVVLLQNVALSCFRGCVYGQSLNRRLARNSTSIFVLEMDIDQSKLGSSASKYLRVREWAEDFVGVQRAPVERRRIDDLPPDTQE